MYSHGNRYRTEYDTTGFWVNVGMNDEHIYTYLEIFICVHMYRCGSVCVCVYCVYQCMYVCLIVHSHTVAVVVAVFEQMCLSYCHVMWVVFFWILYEMSCERSWFSNWFFLLPNLTKNGYKWRKNNGFCMFALFRFTHKT